MALVRALLLVLLIFSPLWMGGCSSLKHPLERFEYAQIIMGIEARIILYALDETAARAAAGSAFDRMIELDRVMSDYRRDSELSRVCRDYTPGRPIPISEDLFRVLDRSQAISELSGGAFDVTIAPIVGLWRQARETGRLPSDQAIKEARARSGWRELSIEPDPCTLRLSRDDMRLDLGGIGKGFAADEAIRTLETHDITSCLVEMGGDMLLGAPPPDQNGWKVAIEPAGRPEKPLILNLSHAGVATSGDTEQYVEIDGVRYSHIVDPRTGLGLTNRIAVTVLAPDATAADALASAISVLGPEEGLALADRLPGVEAMIEVRTSAGVQRHLSRGFPLPPESAIQ